LSRSDYALKEKNYLKLSNPPKEFVDLCVSAVNEYKEYPWKIKMSNFHFSSDVDDMYHEKFKKIVPQKIYNVSVNLITKAILPLTHIDRGRKAALQMPVVADPDVHKVYVLRREKFWKKLKADDKDRGEFRKGNKPELTEWKNERYPGMPMFHYFDEKYMQIDYVEPLIPYITDTSLPHGGMHYDGHRDQPINERWFISVSLAERTSVAEREEIFKDWL